MIPKCAETPSQLWIEKYVFITIYLSLSFGAQETYNGYRGQGRWPKVQFSLFQKPIFASSNSFKSILVHFCYEICINHHLLNIFNPVDSTRNSNIFPLIKISDIFNTNQWNYD